MKIDELDRQGKTNSQAFLACCKKYRAASQHYSSNTGEIKSMLDITNNLRAICTEESQRKEDIDILVYAVDIECKA